MEDTDRRFGKLVLATPEYIHPAVRIGDFLCTERQIGRIHDVFRLLSGDYGDSIVESVGALKIPLRQTRKNLFPNGRAIEYDYEPVSFSRVTTFGIGVLSAHEWTNECWYSRFESPVLERAARIESIGEFTRSIFRARIPGTHIR